MSMKGTTQYLSPAGWDRDLFHDRKICDQDFVLLVKPTGPQIFKKSFSISQDVTLSAR